MATVRRPFYRGELVDLVVPTPDHVENSSWMDWFNSQKTTRYLDHAVFPNTVERQREFLANLQSSNRLALLITVAGHDDPIGTVSLSNIDLRQRAATIAIVLDTERDAPGHPLAALEAMALLTSHAFEVIGLERVEGGQVYPALSRWAQMLELLGYRAEGFRRNAFRRGRVVSDTLLMSAVLPRYEALVAERGGQLWPGADAMLELLRGLPRRSFADVLDEAIRRAETEYFD